MDEADRECRVDEALRLLERALTLVDGVNEDAAMHLQTAIDRLMYGGCRPIPRSPALPQHSRACAFSKNCGGAGRDKLPTLTQS